MKSLNLLRKTVSAIEKSLAYERSLVVGITGHALSGKSTFADRLRKTLRISHPSWKISLIHGDVFVSQRQKSFSSNAEWEKYFLNPKGTARLWRSYDVESLARRIKNWKQRGPVTRASARRLLLVEGCQVVHEKAVNSVDILVILEASAEVRFKRIRERAALSGQPPSDADLKYFFKRVLEPFYKLPERKAVEIIRRHGRLVLRSAFQLSEMNLPL